MPVATLVQGRRLGPVHLFLALPAGSGSVEAPCVASLAKSMSALAEAGIGADLCIEAGNCHVDDARNSLVRSFLASRASDLVFIDADVSWSPCDLVRLARHDADVVAGVYPKKQDDGEFPVMLLGGASPRDDGLLAVEGAPTGFMRIRRHVLETLAESHAGRAFRGQGAAELDAPYHPIFERVIEAGRRWSGDYAFCRKWRALGGAVFVDPEMTFGHTGPKTWSGTLGDHLRRRSGVEAPALIDGLRRLKSGEFDEAAFGDIYRAWGNPRWSALPDMLLTAYLLARRTRGAILEIGSGLTTLVLAAGAARHGAVVHTLEGDALWAGRVRRALDAAGLSATVEHAPVREWDDGAFWHDPAWGMLPRRPDVVVCDGPERRYGRSGLFSLMRDRIDGADWLFDDADDPAILDMVRREAGDREVHVLGTEGMKRFALVLGSRS